MMASPRVPSNVGSGGLFIHGACAPGENSSTPFVTFCLGIYRAIRRDSGVGFKASKCLVRISGPITKDTEVYAMAAEIMKAIEAESYDGPKNVRVK